jgi:hypothetical protein
LGWRLRRKLPMLEKVKSISLIIMGENQSIIHGFMLYYELERAHNTDPLGGARDGRVNDFFATFEACA